jgi:hypothetical protein
MTDEAHWGADDAGRRHLLITGTGRSGTTVMARLLGELGIDTGADRGRYHPEARAGFEFDIRKPGAPYAVKNPELAAQLPGLLRSGELQAREIDHVLILLRDLDQSAASRIDQTRRKGYLRSPGGIVGVTWPGRQQDELARRIYSLVATLAEHDIPFTVISFPRFARDSQYCYRHLQRLIDVPAEEFEDAWRAVVDPGLINTYDTRPLSLYANLKILYRDLRHRVIRKAALLGRDR